MFSAFERTKKIAEFCISLYCKGLRLHFSTEYLREQLVKRRAGLGSGLELKISSPQKIFYVNIPVEENFVSQSPYQLIAENGKFWVKDFQQNKDFVVEIITPPDWYFQKTKLGTVMAQIGVLQGTYLGIYIGQICNFWKLSPSRSCQFCATGFNVGKHEAEEKTVEDVVEVAQMAKKKSNITFVHLNSGYQKGNDLKQMIPYIHALKKNVGVLVGVQAIPSQDLSEYDALIQAGVDHFSFCYEFHHPEFFQRYLPGKHEYIGQKRFFQAIEYVARKTPKGSVSGEIIAGIEPIESTLAGIGYITDHGAFPTVCIFRPLLQTPLQNFPSPNEEDMKIVLRYVAQTCIKKQIPVGLVPNLEVSLVMTPDDCRYLLQRSFSWYISHYKLKLLRLFARPYFAWKMRTKFLR